VVGVVGWPVPPPDPWLGVVGVVVPPWDGAVVGVVVVVSVSVESVSVSSVLVRSPRFSGVLGTPRSVGLDFGSLSPPALAITTIKSSSRTAAAPAATMRRRL
jgi:hypothetical protein